MKIIVITSSAIFSLLLMTNTLAMAQTDQLFHLEELANTRGVPLPPIEDKTVENYKILLAAQMAIDEIGDPSHPINSTVFDPTLANIDGQILNYLCEIDTTYCHGGANYPLRVNLAALPKETVTTNETKSCQSRQSIIEFFKLNWNNTMILPTKITNGPGGIMSAYPKIVSSYDKECGGKFTEYINPNLNVREKN
jgi:hypothetical protein